jgi:hypothetical protein
MAIFGGSKKVYVSSVVYNLAGDINDRANFLKTTVFAKAINNTSKQSMGEHITDTYLNGPGIKLRSFGRWARIYGYSNKVGMSPMSIATGDDVDVDALKLEIPLVSPATDMLIQTAEIGVAGYTYWVDQYMLENHPDLINTDYVANFDGTTIVIVFEDTTTTSFTPTDYDPFKKFLYATYTYIYPPYDEAVETGDVEDLDPLDPFPSITGWDILSESSTPTPYDLVTTIRVQVDWSNSTPDTDNTTSSTVSGSYDEIHNEYEKLTYKGQHPTLDAVWSELEMMFQDQEAEVITLPPDVDVVVEDMGGGVTKTTTTTVTEQVLDITRTYRIDTQAKIDKEWGPTKALIYGYNTGNAALDAMFGAENDGGIVFPFIPVRIDNRFVSNTFFASDYPWVKKAVRRAMGGKMTFDKLVNKVSDNPSLGQVDYAFVVFGASLNTKDMAAISYLYEFFKQMMLGSGPGAGPVLGFEIAFAAANASIDEWTLWKAAQSVPLDPLFGTPEPPILPYPSLPGYRLQFASGTRTDLNFNYVISWAGAAESVHSGLGRPGAKVGDYWMVDQGSSFYPMKIYNGNEWIDGDGQSLNRITIYWQDEPDSYRQMNVYNLHHRNNIYGSRTIEITGSQALADPDESGFIIPLHEDVYKQAPLVEATQMATAVAYMVFNCITIVKQKWYETIVFKIILVIVIIAVTIWIGGAGIAAAPGLLGTNAAVGAALGFTGTAAAIVGAIANALAAMILTQIIQYGANAIFGEKIGALVGAIASVIAVSAGSVLMSGGSLAAGFSQLMQPENLLRLTMAAGEGYSRYMQIDLSERVTKMQNELDSLSRQNAEVQDRYREAFGNRGFLDPLAIGTVDFNYVPESSQSFLTRTMMTGGDIADLCVNMPSNFLLYTATPILPVPGSES